MNSNDLNRFHRDLTAALTAGVTLQSGGEDRLTRARTDGLYRQIQAVKQQAGEDQTQFGANQNGSEQLPNWYRAALKVFAKTDSTVPVLEGLSTIPQAIEQIRRAFRWTIICLLLVLATGLGGMIVFQIHGAPALQAFRQEFLPTTADPAAQLFDISTIAIAIPAFGTCLFSVWLFFGGLTRLALWLGGQQFVRAVTSGSILRITQSLLWSGMSANEAVALGCTMTGVDSRTQRELLSVVAGCSEAHTVGQMADFFNFTANQRLIRLQFVTSTILYLLVGGVFSLLSGLVMFAPVFTLLNDIATSEM